MTSYNYNILYIKYIKDSENYYKIIIKMNLFLFCGCLWGKGAGGGGGVWGLGWGVKEIHPHHLNMKALFDSNMKNDRINKLFM